MAAASELPVWASQVQVPESWAPIIKPQFNNTDRTVELTYYDTQLVSTGAKRDTRLGPWPFPEKRGELSTALLEAVKLSGQDVWPDWEGDVVTDQVHATQIFDDLAGFKWREFCECTATTNG